MAHWGWYWKIKKKHISRTLCSKLPSIDSFNLQATNGMKKLRVEPLGIKAKGYKDELIITYGRQSQSPYRIPIDKQACNYGGFRYYFRCPLCKRRMRMLYFAENSIFLCRKCLNLSYKSQKLRPANRYTYMEQKAKDIVKKRGGNLELCEKPPGMHNSTYQKLQSKQSYYESKLHQASNKELREWYGPKIEPYLDGYFDYVDEAKNR